MSHRKLGTLRNVAESAQVLDISLFLFASSDSASWHATQVPLGETLTKKCKEISNSGAALSLVAGQASIKKEP
jgi:hypothetical protein